MVKESIFAVLDFMLLNSLFAWNLSANDVMIKCLMITKFAFSKALTEEMIMFVNKEHITGDDQFKNPLSIVSLKLCPIGNQQR
jgi:hypothetical protein